MTAPGCTVSIICLSFPCGGMRGRRQGEQKGSLCIWRKWWHRCSCCCVHSGNSSLSYVGEEMSKTHGTDYWEKIRVTH